MSGRPWFGLHDPALDPALRDLLHLRSPLRWEGDPSALRPLLREHGITVEVRPASPLVMERDDGDGPELLIAGERVLLVTRDRRRWHLATPSGPETMAPHDAMAALDPRTAWEWRRDAETPWRALEIPASLGRRLLNRLGTSRGEAVARWLRQVRHAVRSPAGVVRLACRHPERIPCSLPPLAGEPMPWLSVRFHRHVPLRRDRSPWRSLLALPWRERRLLGIMLGLALLGVPLGYGLSLFMSVGVDLATDGAMLSSGLLWLAGAVHLLATLLGGARSWVIARLLSRWRLWLTDSYLLRIAGARPGPLRRLTDGDLYTRLQDLFTLHGIMVQQLLPTAISLLSLAGGLLYVALAAPVMLLPLVVTGLGELALLGWSVPRLQALRRERLAVDSEIREQVLARIEGRRSLRRYDRTGRLLAPLDALLARAAELDRREGVVGAWLGLLSGILGTGTITATVFLVATRYRGGAATLGTIVVVLGIVYSVDRSLRQLINIVPALASAEPSVRRLEEVIAASEPEILSPSRPVPPSSSLLLEVTDLRGGWNDSDAVRDVSFSLPPGHWLAVVGASGSGKSTLAALLGGLLRPRQGTIHVAGRDGTHRPHELHRHVAVVGQDTFLLDRTIRENILLGNRTAGDEEIARVVAATGLAPLIARLPRGLDQHVGDDGIRLAVGEKCRLGIARALLRRPAVLVLDEALARVDVATANDIAGRLRELGLAVVLLTHDLRRAATCDRLLVLRDGVPIQSGTFASLLEDDGELRQLVLGKPCLASAAGGDR